MGILDVDKDVDDIYGSNKKVSLNIRISVEFMDAIKLRAKLEQRTVAQMARIMMSNDQKRYLKQEVLS
jgi:hypothetical protein